MFYKMQNGAPRPKMLRCAPASYLPPSLTSAYALAQANDSGGDVEAAIPLALTGINTPIVVGGTVPTGLSVTVTLLTPGNPTYERLISVLGCSCARR
jgi:hypothetical protein